MEILKFVKYLQVTSQIVILTTFVNHTDCATQETFLKHISELDKATCYKELKCVTGSRVGLLLNDTAVENVGTSYMADTMNDTSVSYNETSQSEQELLNNPCCVSDCSCDVNTCVTEGTCCLDVLTSLPNIDDVKSRVQMTCEYPQLRPYTEFLMSMKRMSNAETPVRMIRRCPDVSSDVTGYDVRTKCERPEKFNDLSTKIPVVDNTTLFTYQNKYCALCNGVSEMDTIFWDARIECLMDSFYPRNWKDLTVDILETSDCNLLYDIPKLEGMNRQECQKSIFECNRTGKWNVYNETIETACLSYSREFIHSYERYKNVFCYMCNNDVSSDVNASSSSSVDSSCLFERIMPEQWPGLVTFSTKINLGQGTDFMSNNAANGTGIYPNNTCTGNQIFDPVVKTCRDVQCMFPKTLTRGRCTDIAEEYKGITYQTCLEMSLLNRDLGQVDVHLDLSPLQEKVKQWLNSTLNYALSGHWFFGVSIKLPSNVEKIEKIDLNYVAVKFWFKQNIMTSFSFLDKVLAIDKTVFLIELHENVTLKYHVKLAHWMCNAGNDDIITRSRTQGALTPILVDANDGPEFRYNNFGDAIKEPRHIQQISKFNACPHVVLVQTGQALKESEYGYYLDAYQKYVAFEDVLVTNKFDINAGSVTSLNLCLDTLMSLFNMDVIDNVVTLPVSVPTVTYTFDVTNVAVTANDESNRDKATENGTGKRTGDRIVLLLLFFYILY